MHCFCPAARPNTSEQCLACIRTSRPIYLVFLSFSGCWSFGVQPFSVSLIVRAYYYKSLLYPTVVLFVIAVFSRGSALKLVAYGDDDDSDEDLESPGRERQHTYEKGQEEHGASSSSVTPMVVAESGSERGSASTPERVAGDGEGVSGEGPRERRAGESPSSVNGIVSEATSPAETSSGSTEGGGEGDENADGSDGGEAKDDAPSDLSRGGPSGGDPDPKRLRRST